MSRKKPNRKTKSLEKIKRPLVVNEYDRTHDEKDFSTMGYSQGTSDLILENQDNVRSSIRNLNLYRGNSFSKSIIIKKDAKVLS